MKWMIMIRSISDRLVDWFYKARPIFETIPKEYNISEFYVPKIENAFFSLEQCPDNFLRVLKMFDPDFEITEIFIIFEEYEDDNDRFIIDKIDGKYVIKYRIDNKCYEMNYSNMSLVEMFTFIQTYYILKKGKYNEKDLFNRFKYGDSI